jgi:hypothetical protein
MNLISRLSSMRFAFLVILLLAGWFLAGAYMAGKAFRKIFSSMNEMLIVEWWQTVGHEALWVKIWFAVLCILAALLALSFLFCTFSTLVARIRRSTRKSLSVVLFLIHFFGLILVGLHGLSILIGYKLGEEELFPGEEIVLPDGVKLVIDQVVFVNDTSLLYFRQGQPRIRYHRENYALDSNYVHLSFYRDGHPVQSDKLLYMKPIRTNGLLVTLDSFVAGHQNGGTSEAVGVKITAVKNPVMIPFFVVYALSVLVLALFLVYRLRQNGILPPLNPVRNCPS